MWLKLDYCAKRYFLCCSYRSSLTKFFCTFQAHPFKYIFLSDVFRLRLIKNTNMIKHKCTTTEYFTHKRASWIVIFYPFVGALKQNACDVSNIYFIVFYIHFIQSTIKMFLLLHIAVIVLSRTFIMVFRQTILYFWR
jgi:hypothetical protein